ncbi:MAG: carbohydrate ABC transporter permease [Lachnospiraceae bacterium]
MRTKKRKTLFLTIKPYLFLIPIYLLLVIFKYIPFGMAIQKSFYNWNGGNLNIFIGFQNYLEAFSDKIFLGSLLTVFKVLIVYVLIVITVPLLAAELLFAVKSSKKQYFIRTAFTFPMVVPGVVVILLWKWILAGDTGVLNNILEGIGLTGLVQPWLGNSHTALWSILAIGFPWLGIASLGGMQFLIYFGALQGIPKDLFEAGQLDGTNIIKRFFYIDLPMLASQIKLMITLAIISSLQIFDAIFILVKGGPGTSTMVPAVYLYEQGFTYKRMGYSSALGILLFILIMILSILNNKFLKSTDTMD